MTATLDHDLSIGAWSNPGIRRSRAAARCDAMEPGTLRVATCNRWCQLDEIPESTNTPGASRRASPRATIPRRRSSVSPTARACSRVKAACCLAASS
ncbi:hypothetical protein HC251_08750 [Iamia sp. SCSIO 61187]|uniref:hypothetical protein n=1 Tax=Iamia sp. SCSIO 61187 TaxID=2722752 RepID=UPI001C6369B9|nr:hypothetical protein [Iamia sp. SCSIO 61187]QYG92521.1 hypothetical protein HC251_08750 [Iamia sp. SCSIO 61187]